MKKLFLLFMFAMLSWSAVKAQIADGSIAPDFTAVDLDGNSHHLYELLDAGYTVFLDVSATWCGPCWNYHNSGALENLYDQYGPNGTNEVRVFFAEGDPSTNLACLYGPSGCVGGTQGDWVTGTPYPILHAQGPSIANSYQITYYPTIFCICPLDKKVYEAGQQGTSGLYDFMVSHCAPPELLVNPPVVTNIKCFGGNTGAIDITPSGGVPPYTYHWSNNATTQDLHNIPAGTYTVTITGTHSTSAISDPIEVVGPDAPLTVALESTTPVGCNGILGTATVSASGGWNANYTYNWQNGQSGETAQSLSTGNYNVSVTDDGGCTTSMTVNMAPVVYPTAAIAAPGQINCNQPSVQLNGTGSSSGPEFSYQWFAAAGGHIVNGATTTTPTVDAGGNYTIQVTNTQTTCVSYATKSVSADLVAPNADAGASQHISCTQPEATLQGVGSTGSNFSYSWTVANGGNIVSGGTTLNPLVNAAGDYTLKVTNSTNGCTQTSATVVTGTPAPALLTHGGTLNCTVDSLKLITSTNAASPTFSWTGPNNFQSTLQNPIVATSGSYVVVVTDSITACTSTATANVTVNTNLPGASATGNSITCLNSNVVINGTTSDTLAKYTWSGPNNFQSTLQNPTVSDAGTYYLVVTDSINGCTSTASALVALNNQAPVASALTPGNLNCNTSQLQLNGTGSSQGASISYSWTAADGGHIVSGENTQTPLVDAVGSYTLLVSNAETGCTQTASANVVQSTAVTAAIAAQNDVQCYGGASGEATAAGTGGNGVFSYAWSNGGSTASVSGLVAGTYIVVVTDAENCSATSSVVINQPDALSANASVTAQTAFGQNDGTATANPIGGTAGYTYAWDNGETTQTISGLAPGNYSVVVTDAHGCSALQTVTVNSFNCTLAATIDGINLSCHGANNGSAAVSITTAQNPTAYLWSNGATTASVQDLAAGLYTVSITDAANCPAVFSINITEPTQVLANATTTPESAAGANDGTASANPTGGTGAYTYGWNNGEATQTISNLAPGAYSVIVTDANGCTSEQSVEVASFLCAITSQNTITNVRCAGEANGAVTISLHGGTAPFNYNWSNGAQTATISNLSGGTYTVVVSDVNGCQFTSSATVNEPAPYSAWNINMVQPICPNDASGSAVASISGGTEPYSFLWSNGTTGNALNNVAAGTYTVQVNDANGCQASQSITLSANDSEAPSVSVQEATVALSANGTAAVTLTDIAAQFSDNCGVASTSIQPAAFDCSQLGVQTVILTVTDLSGNTATVSTKVTVTDNIAPVVSCPSNIVACSYDNLVNYAAPVAEDNCLLAGNGHWTVDGPASGSIFPEGTTTISYTYTDASGNAGSCSFTVTVTSAVSFTAINVNNDVNSQHVGSVDITVEGGTGPYSFAWTNETGEVIATTEDVTGLSEGTYKVKVTDANGCAYDQEVKVQNTSGLKEPTWLGGLSVQPNPAGEFTRVVFAEPMSTQVEIAVIDATGRILSTRISEQEKEVRIDCSDLPGGVYTLRFRTGKEIGARKLVVNK